MLFSYHRHSGRLLEACTMGRLSQRGAWSWRSSEGLVTFAVAFAVFTVSNTAHEHVSNLTKSLANGWIIGRVGI